MKRLLLGLFLSIALSTPSFAGKYADITITNPQDTPPGLHYSMVVAKVLFSEVAASGEMELVTDYITGVPLTGEFVYVSNADFDPTGVWYAIPYYNYTEFRRLNYDDGKWYLGRWHNGASSNQVPAGTNEVSVTGRVTWRLDPNQN